MTEVKEYKFKEHSVKISVIYPLANFSRSVYNSPDICQAELIATIDRNLFENVKDNLLAIERRLNTIEADIERAINTFISQEIIADTTFRRTLIDLNYSINQN